MMTTTSRRGRAPRSNRRRHKRAPLARRVQFVHGSRVHSLPLKDISEGGLCLEGPARLPRKQRIKLFIPVPQPGSKDKLSVLWGEVVWAGEGRVGMRFVDPPLESLLQLRSYIQLAA